MTWWEGSRCQCFFSWQLADCRAQAANHRLRFRRSVHRSVGVGEGDVGDFNSEERAQPCQASPLSDIKHQQVGSAPREVGLTSRL